MNVKNVLADVENKKNNENVNQLSQSWMTGRIMLSNIQMTINKKSKGN